MHLTCLVVDTKNREKLAETKDLVNTPGNSDLTDTIVATCRNQGHQRLNETLENVDTVNREHADLTDTIDTLECCI